MERNRRRIFGRMSTNGVVDFFAMDLKFLSRINTDANFIAANVVDHNGHNDLAALVANNDLFVSLP